MTSARCRLPAGETWPSAIAVAGYSRRLAEQTPLPVLLRDITLRWKLALAVTLAVLAGGAVYAESLPDRYTSMTVVSFSPKPDVNAGAGAVRVVLPRYLHYVGARQTVNRVAARTGQDPDTLDDGVDAAIEPESGNLTISVELESGEAAAQAANALAAETVAFAETDRLLDAVVVARALPTRSPSGPPRRLLELAALVVGALLGVTAAVLLERGRPRVRSWHDVTAVTGYPVLGRVPSSRSIRDAPEKALTDPAVGAAMRTLRTHLDRVSRDRPTHVLAVTSSVLGEGKTTVAASLATTLSRLDARVLLVDADLRRPHVSSLFRIDPHPGLNDVLNGHVPLDVAVQRGPDEQLFLLAARPDSDAGDLLARELASVLRLARANYDIVVVDCPPVLMGADARTIALLSDGVLFVVGADTLAQAVGEAASALDSLGETVLGAVTNRMRRSTAVGEYRSYALDEPLDR